MGSYLAYMHAYFSRKQGLHSLICFNDNTVNDKGKIQKTYLRKSCDLASTISVSMSSVCKGRFASREAIAFITAASSSLLKEDKRGNLSHIIISDATKHTNHTKKESRTKNNINYTRKESQKMQNQNRRNKQAKQPTGHTTSEGTVKTPERQDVINILGQNC